MANEDLSKLKIDKSSVEYRPLRRKKASYWIGGIILLSIIIILYLTGVLSPAKEITVTTITKLYPSQTFTLLNASGYIVAERKAAVASKVTGRLVKLAVEEGSHVQGGQIIAQLENDDVVASRNQVKANLNVAKHHLEVSNAELNEATLSFQRTKELFEEQYVSKAVFDTAEARYNKARAAVSAAEAEVNAAHAALEAADVAVEYTMIRAPFDGVVLTKNADVGDIVAPVSGAAEAKAAVVTMADMDSLQVEVDVAESNIALVKSGQPCEIQLDAIPDERFRGFVHMVVPTADRTKATVLVKIRFQQKDERILPEMSAKVAFLSREVTNNEEQPITAVKKGALVSKDNETFVFRVEDGTVSKMTVSPGKEFGEMIEIHNGIKAGEQVVLEPPPAMRSGTKIKVEKK
jgi:RND family efflux transporter MFP subunit